MKPFTSPPEKYYQVLLKLLGKCEEFEGDPTQLWGGEKFEGSTKENFPRIIHWFCAYTLPHVTSLLLSLPELFSDPVTLCDQRNRDAVVLSKRQCAALLAMSFFCANPVSCAPRPYDDFQSIVVFSTWLECPSFCNKAKLFMLMNYFERTRLQIKDENFEIHRLQLSKPVSLASWMKREEVLSDFQVRDSGGITETCGGDVLHVDFANKYIGGGVLGMGAVQEEIMFSVAPELLTSLMFCSVMRDNEALLLINADKYAQHTGYNTGLNFAGDFVDDSHTCRVAIDATCFGWGTGTDTQWTQQNVLRELNKAFVGFDNEFPTKGSSIATGNWGCGAFGGNIQLKSLLQWCAASACGRPVQYYTFKDRNCKGLGEVVEVVMESGVTVGTLMQTVLSYCEFKSSGKVKTDLFEFVKQSVG